MINLISYRTICTLIMWALLTSLASTVLASVEQPKLMIIMQEKVMGVFGQTSYEQPNQAETSLMGYFSRSGFLVLDPATVKRNLTQAKGLRLLEGDDKAAAALGLQYGSDYSIVGTAISKQAGAKLYGTQMQTIHATLTARVIRNSDARVIAVGSASAAQAHIDEVRGGTLAIDKAARELAQDLGNQIKRAHVIGPGPAAHDMTINISGLVSYRHLDFVMTHLQTKVPGVKKVQLRMFSAGVAELGIDYAGPISDLARHLASERFTGFRLEPTNVTSNRIDIKAVLDRQ